MRFWFLLAMISPWELYGRLMTLLAYFPVFETVVLVKEEILNEEMF